MANAEPYALTKLDIAALKACDYLWFGLGRETEEEFGHIDLIKRAPDASEKNPFPQEGRHVLKAPVTVRKDYRKRDYHYECRAVVYPYWDQCTEVSSMLSILRPDDTIIFIFHPDCRSTEDLLKAGFHHDVLYMRVFRKGRHIAEFGLYDMVSPDRWRLCRETAPVGAIADQSE